MELLPGSYPEFNKFFAVLVRVSVILFLLPFFNARIVPALTKAGLALLISIVLFPVVRQAVGPAAETPGSLLMLVLGEFLIGLVLSLMVLLFFESIKMMGHTVGFQTGFAITNVIDPQNQTQISLMASLAYMVSLIVFLSLDGHHVFIGALKDSFEVIPPGAAGMEDRLFQMVIDSAGQMFAVAVKIGSPAIVALLFTKVAFGLITKLIPQMNIMIVAFPVQIVIGLIFFGISMQLLPFFIREFINALSGVLITAMNWMRI